MFAAERSSNSHTAHDGRGIRIVNPVHSSFGLFAAPTARSWSTTIDLLIGELSMSVAFLPPLFVLVMAGLHPTARADHTPTPQVWVVTDSHHPVRTSAGVRLIELDAPARLNAELASSLPRDPAQAAVIARQRLAARDTEIEHRLADAYQGIIDAWTLGVAKVPAVVVDRAYVIYGETDVDRAVAKIDQYRSNQP